MGFFTPSAGRPFDKPINPIPVGKLPWQGRLPGSQASRQINPPTNHELPIEIGRHPDIPWLDHGTNFPNGMVFEDMPVFRRLSIQISDLY